MDKVTYDKSPLTFSQQITRLENKGMFFENKKHAEAKLASISYYRLSGYWYPFRIRNSQNIITSKFEPGTNFNEVVSLYEFDRKLRSLVLDAIERVEIAVRTQFTYQMGHKYGAFGYTNSENFHKGFDHNKWLSKIKSEVDRSSDDFIEHFNNKYTGFPIVPIWMLTEVMSLGALSFGYRGLINNQAQGIEDKKLIANHFNLHHKKLEDWLHTLTYVRNVCAHHSRLWNRTLAIRPDKTKDKKWLPPMTPRNDKIFYIPLMLRHLLKATGNGEDWKTEIDKLISPLATKKRWRAAMGIPEDWTEHPLWR
ncbi:Abi family protein [Psychrobacter sanguinis]|uniref:Abi family protein n=1 Tax=Psychrobacter sanguinis TaxID=861445 RepID=UPI00191B8457|nr:Abi family protein [Psychrobacter sanguinis]UEC25121.1 Abi family protein [Psychrobacter sanguinis]